MHVFLEESVDVSCSFEAVRGRCLGDENWFAPFVAAAKEDGGGALPPGSDYRWQICKRLTKSVSRSVRPTVAETR